MGAWGTGIFENDDALDWLLDLETAKDAAFLLETFSAVNQADEDIEAWDASFALAAAEVVAALLGKPIPDPPEEVSAWAARVAPTIQADKPALHKNAIQATQTVLENSELKELWAETDELDEWITIGQELISRLQSI